MIGRFESEHQHRRAAVADAGEDRLERIEQPAVARVESRLRERPDAGDGGEIVGELHGCRGAKAWRSLQPHPRFGDDAERAFRSEDQPVGRRARARTRQAASLHDARGRHHARGLDEVVDVRVLRGVVAARARGDPAAERRELETLREMSQGQPMRLELRFEFGPERAGLDARRTADGIDVEHLIEPFEVERHRACVAFAEPCIDAAAHAAAATVRNHRDVLRLRPVEDVDDRLLVLGIDDPVRQRRRLAQPHARAVGVTLAGAVIQAIQWRGRELRGQSVRRGHPRFRQDEFARLRYRLLDVCRADLGDHRLHGGALARVQGGVGPTPAPEPPLRATRQRGLSAHDGGPRRINSCACSSTGPSGRSSA